MTMPPEQESYLREHHMGVLSTGRSDGSPQISTINYDYDGTDIVISVTSDRAKWVNTQRQPKVALLVLDGRKLISLLLQLLSNYHVYVVLERRATLAGPRSLGAGRCMGQL